MFGAQQLCELAEHVNMTCRNGDIEREIHLASELITMTNDVLQRLKTDDAEPVPEFVSQAIGAR